MIDNIKHLAGLVSAGLETNEYVIINSAWLTLMGIRTNNDLDLILSSRLWRSQFSEYPPHKSFGLPGPLNKRIRVHSLDKGNYVNFTDIQSNDEAVYHHRIVLEGLPFIEPRFYFQYLLARLKINRDKIKGISWWRKNLVVSKNTKKMKNKIAKDIKTVKSLKKYFRSASYKVGFLKHITSAQWGKNCNELDEIFG